MYISRYIKETAESSSKEIQVLHRHYYFVQSVIFSYVAEGFKQSINRAGRFQTFQFLNSFEL